METVTLIAIREIVDNKPGCQMVIAAPIFKQDHNISEYAQVLALLKVAEKRVIDVIAEKIII